VIFIDPYLAAAFVFIDLFGSEIFGALFGPGRIHQQKQVIQDFQTPFFRSMKKLLAPHLELPLRDGHALEFQSDGVQQQFARHPELAALKPAFMARAEDITSTLLGYSRGTAGVAERFVNQFIANAAINDWTPDITNALYTLITRWVDLVAATGHLQ